MEERKIKYVKYFISGCVLFGTILQISHSAPLSCYYDSSMCLPGEAVCDKDVCLCHSGSGLGQLACHENFETVCHIHSDSVLHTFNGEDFYLPLPCRFLLAEATLQPRLEQQSRLCEIRVYSYSERVDNYFYVAGFDVFLKYTNDLGIDHELGFRATGSVDSEWYNFNLWVKPTHDHDWVKVTSKASWARLADEEAEARLEETVFRIDGATRRVVLLLDFCGLRVYFRPANTGMDGKMEGQLMPGLSLGLDQSYQYSTTFNHDSVALCHLRTGDNRNLTGIYSRIYDMEMNPTVLYRALSSGVSQYPPASPFCSRLMQTVDTQCTDVTSTTWAMDTCSIMLTTPTFVNCWSGSESRTSEKVLTLFNTCVQALCLRHERQCYGFIEEILDTKCVESAYDLLIDLGCKFEQDVL